MRLGHPLPRGNRHQATLISTALSADTPPPIRAPPSPYARDLRGGANTTSSVISSLME